jgi:hypothetical protein
MSRARGTVETPEFAQMVGRVIRAYGRRMGEADPEDLAVMVAVRNELDAAILDGVYRQNIINERSWTEIGQAVGLTRAGAYERWGRQVKARAVQEGTWRERHNGAQRQTEEVAQ